MLCFNAGYIHTITDGFTVFHHILRNRYVKTFWSIYKCTEIFRGSQKI